MRSDENGAKGMRLERKGKDDSADCCCAAVLSDGDASAATKNCGIASAATNDGVASVATTDEVASAVMANNWVASAATGGSMAG
jgi:hypothetical protein